MGAEKAEAVNISRVLDKELCEKLVKAASLTIGCNVLVTDEKGYVYASNMKEREGTLHEGSLEVLESGKTTWHDEAAVRRLAGTMPGITIPLFIENQVIGTIGITGEPKTVADYAALVQQMTQVFMSFQRRQQTSAGMDIKLQNLVREIVQFDARIRHPQEIHNMAFELGADLELPRAVILIQKAAGLQQHPGGKGDNVSDGDVLQVWGIFCTGLYRHTENGPEAVSVPEAVPAKMIFSKQDGRWQLTDFQVPEDSGFFGKDMKELFPWHLRLFALMKGVFENGLTKQMEAYAA